MVKILFVCHGNICRSPMAESMLADLIEKRGLKGRLFVSSRALHTDEIGNPPHRGTVAKLREEGIPLVPHRAKLLTREDAENFDRIIGMDEENLRDLKRMLGVRFYPKISLLFDYTDTPRAIADPWYTGDFDETYEDLKIGIEALLADLKEHGEL